MTPYHVLMDADGERWYAVWPLWDYGEGTQAFMWMHENEYAFQIAICT